MQTFWAFWNDGDPLNKTEIILWHKNVLSKKILNFDGCFKNSLVWLEVRTVAESHISE